MIRRWRLPSSGRYSTDFQKRLTMKVKNELRSLQRWRGWLFDFKSILFFLFIPSATFTCWKLLMVMILGRSRGIVEEGSLILCPVWYWLITYINTCMSEQVWRSMPSIHQILSKYVNNMEINVHTMQQKHHFIFWDYNIFFWILIIELLTCLIKERRRNKSDSTRRSYRMRA